MLKEGDNGQAVDLEEGVGEGVVSLDPNQRTCYDPMMEKMKPVIEKVQPAVDTVKPVVISAGKKISEFFEDDENEVMTEETIDGEIQEKTMVRITPTTFGAAVVGMVVGSIILGPFIGLACAGGAGYATTRDGKIGEVSKAVGKKTYNGLRRGYIGTKEFVESKIALARGSADAGAGAQTVPVAVPVVSNEAP